MREAAALLAGEGRSAIALLDLDVGGSHRLDKRKAFQSALARPGAAARAPIFSMRAPYIEEAIRVTQQALDSRPKPDALVLSDNFFADAVMLALRQRGT